MSKQWRANNMAKEALSLANSRSTLRDVSVIYPDG
jgi:hypothetical protein